MEFNDFKEVLKLYESTVNMAFKEEHDILQYLRRKSLKDKNEQEFERLVK